jgi:hypothetical protein
MENNFRFLFCRDQNIQNLSSPGDIFALRLFKLFEGLDHVDRSDKDN